MALNGNFSFAGAYAILEKIIDKKKEVKTLVIINNVYAWQENIKHTKMISCLTMKCTSNEQTNSCIAEMCGNGSNQIPNV